MASPLIKMFCEFNDLSFDEKKIRRLANSYTRLDKNELFLLEHYQIAGVNLIVLYDFTNSIIYFIHDDCRLNVKFNAKKDNKLYQSIIYFLFTSFTYLQIKTYKRLQLILEPPLIFEVRNQGQMQEISIAYCLQLNLIFGKLYNVKKGLSTLLKKLNAFNKGKLVYRRVQKTNDNPFQMSLFDDMHQNKKLINNHLNLKQILFDTKQK